MSVALFDVITHNIFGETEKDHEKVKRAGNWDEI
jgi:hypothetical protein